MIRLVTEQDRARVLSLCRKDAWDGTELLAAYSARCADKGGVDWRRCDLWIGESETQKKNIQYLLCRVGENYRLVGAPRSPTRWEELHAFLQLQPAGTLTAREEVVDEYCRRFSPEGQERARGGTRMLCQRIPNDITGSVVTECQLIAGLYRCEGGEIRYPHTAEDRPQVMYIPQKAHIFRDTLCNNLTMGSSFSDSQLLCVLEQCGLSDFLASLPNGLSSFLDGAACCSGGEAQRISLARAILQRPSILIADEITANLDHQNAHRIESLLLSLQDTMVISIGHRLLPEVLSRYDCILTMAEGSIVESGSFSPLEK